MIIPIPKTKATPTNIVLVTKSKDTCFWAPEALPEEVEVDVEVPEPEPEPVSESESEPVIPVCLVVPIDPDTVPIPEAPAAFKKALQVEAVEALSLIHI